MEVVTLSGLINKKSYTLHLSFVLKILTTFLFRINTGNLGVD